MRAISTFAAFGIALIVLSACAQKPASTAQSDATAKTDSSAQVSAKPSSNKAGTERLYEELMDRILEKKITAVPSRMNHKKGDKNPYREGIRGHSHKALAACLIWNTDALTVDFDGWYAFGSRDWSFAELGATKDCRERKKRLKLNCTCQVIDHDDENVLKVPADFLAKYEKKFSATDN